MPVLSRRTIIPLIATLVCAVSVNAAPPDASSVPWHDSFTARLEALALLQSLNADLLSHDSATLTLDRWCAAHHLVMPVSVLTSHRPQT